MVILPIGFPVGLIPGVEVPGYIISLCEPLFDHPGQGGPRRPVIGTDGELLPIKIGRIVKPESGVEVEAVRVITVIEQVDVLGEKLRQILRMGEEDTEWKRMELIGNNRGTPLKRQYQPHFPSPLTI